MKVESHTMLFATKMQGKSILQIVLEQDKTIALDDIVCQFRTSQTAVAYPGFPVGALIRWRWGADLRRRFFFKCRWYMVKDVYKIYIADGKPCDTCLFSSRGDQ